MSIDRYIIDPNVSVDTLWMQLGSECCELRAMSLTGFNILQHSFCKSSKYAKYIVKYSKLLRLIQDKMDSIVCSHYLSSQHEIEVNGSKIDIVRLFYGNNTTITKYPVKYDGEYTNQFKEFKHTLTSHDKQYILIFIDRMKCLIDYLENKFDLYNENIQTKKFEKQGLFKIINKSKNLFDNENIINDITVKERP
tara:strand:- start:96 stop:677 length:582 start_codon:yes stop_codon:yes gene_type:complete